MSTWISSASSRQTATYHEVFRQFHTSSVTLSDSRSCCSRSSKASRKESCRLRQCFCSITCPRHMPCGRGMITRRTADDATLRLRPASHGERMNESVRLTLDRDRKRLPIQSVGPDGLQLENQADAWPRSVVF